MKPDWLRITFFSGAALLITDWLIKSYVNENVQTVLTGAGMILVGISITLFFNEQNHNKPKFT